jgi:hypothetical protein
MIYKIFNSNENTVNYVCPDQATIDQGQAYGFQGIYSIGTEQDAQNILTTNQANWLNQNLGLFSVNKDIDVTEGTQWTACNLDEEPDSDDMRYQIFNVIDGYYNEATGLNSAKTLLNQTKQNTQNWFVALNSFETWPTPPSPTLSEGVQTL